MILFQLYEKQYIYDAYEFIVKEFVLVLTFTFVLHCTLVTADLVTLLSFKNTCLFTKLFESTFYNSKKT